MKMKQWILLALFCGTLTLSAQDKFYTQGLFHVKWTPFQLILMPDVQLFDSKTEVRGISVSCSAEIGRNPCYGLCFGGLRARMGNTYGMSFCVVNVSSICSEIVTFAFLNKAEPYRGQTPVQVGAINVTEHGWQLGLFNYNKNSWIPFTMIFNFSPTPELLSEGADGK